jgi:hypothetical protein
VTTQADIRRRVRVWEILRATGPWSRHPHPGQKFLHGWLPVGPLGDAVRKWHRDPVGIRKLIAAVDSGDRSHARLAGGLHGHTELIEHNNGTQTVHKIMTDAGDTMGPGFGPKRQADAEQLIGLMGQRLGAPVPRVLRYDDDEVFMDVVPGERADRAAAAQGIKVNELAAQHGGTVAAARLATLDILAGNWDRGNETNWNVDDNGIVWGYDHALSFWDGDGTTAAAPPEAAGPFAAMWFLHFDPSKQRHGWGGFDWADNPLTPADIAWLRQRLTALQPDFEALGRHDWWQFAMTRLGTIAAHARGTQGVFT